MAAAANTNEGKGYMGKFLAVLVLAASLLLVLPALVAAEDWGAKGFAVRLSDIHADRSTHSDVVGRMKAGDWLKVDLLHDGWYAVFSPYESYRHEMAAIGYVRAGNIRAEIVPVSTGWGEIMTVSSNVNIRADRTTTSKVVGKLVAGQSVRADFYRQGWYAVFPGREAVREEGRAIGYVFGPLLEPADHAMVSER
jgi:hypothetical protein